MRAFSAASMRQSPPDSCSVLRSPMSARTRPSSISSSDMSEQCTYAVFLRRLLIAAALAFGLPYGISEALKIRAGELPPADVADRQMKSKQMLYLSGLDQNVNAY